MIPTADRGIRFSQRNLTLSIEEGRSFHRDAPAPLSVNLFKDDAKLRSHALKHLGNALERGAFHKVLPFDLHQVTIWLDAIRDLGCPFFLKNSESPPCRADGGLCPLFEKCRELARPLEEIYLRRCQEVIEAGGRIPRNAAYRNSEGENFYWALSDQALVAKLIWHPGGYNLMTCLRPGIAENASLREVIARVARDIISEAHGRIDFALPETWQGSKEESWTKSLSSNPKKKNKNPYSRGTKGSWRRYLEDGDGDD